MCCVSKLQHVSPIQLKQQKSQLKQNVKMKCKFKYACTVPFHLHTPYSLAPDCRLRASQHSLQCVPQFRSAKLPEPQLMCSEPMSQCCFISIWFRVRVTNLRPESL
jgi:hypothetical protein